MQKVISIIGPESTGKSELAQFLAQKLGTNWVPEYARTYLAEYSGKYKFNDLLEIAKGQWQRQKSAIETDAEWVILDTDLEVIKVWSEHAFGFCDEWILRRLAEQKIDLYLLTDIDLPWQSDPLREHPLPEQRTYFFQIYKDIVTNSGKPFGIVSGTEQNRYENALKILKSTFSTLNTR